jgi:hypothetical protein
VSAVLDREVVELLRDDPDLLALADAIVATQHADIRHGARVPWRLLAVAAVIVIAVVVAVAAPWHGHGNGLVDRALAAVGRGPVLHAVIETDVPRETAVNLSTGARRPVRQRLEYWYDAERRELRAVTSINGRVLDDEVLPPARLAATGAPPLDPALMGFVSAYRDALRSGQAHEAGRGTFDGRRVVWLRFDYRLFGERVGVDERTYRPIVIEPLDSDGTPARQVWRVAAIDTRAYRPHDFTRAHPFPLNSSMRGANFRMVAPSRVTGLLGWRPWWLGKSFQGLPLQSAQLQGLIHERPVAPTTHGVALAYGHGANRIQLTEARALESTYWLTGLGIPEPGSALLFHPVVSGPGPIERSCQLLLRTGGIWVSVEGWNQASSRCVDAARALVRMSP